jgi:50S ribosomal protein L16 3-hydroxylase
VNRIIPGGMDASTFLEIYWQKQPCLIRQAQSDFKPFISKQELFELACKDDVESRLILESAGDYPWQVTQGPFCEDDFIKLPISHWTLLVQNSELHLPEALAFLNQFQFIPNWRIDDLMISLAPEHGSVGPHLDSYDVFLFQAMGRRRWSINVQDFNEDDFIDGLDLRIIEHFQAEQEWLLEPGDMLYLPPGVAHHGVALDDCMTFSVGLRAPSRHELLGHYLDDMPGEGDDLRYTDPDLSLQSHCGEITKEDLEKIDALFRSALPDKNTLAEWFGSYVTRLPENYEPQPAVPQMNVESFIEAFKNKSCLSKNTAARTAFTRGDEHINLFVNGERYTLPVALEEFICLFSQSEMFDNPLLAQNVLFSEIADLLCQLYNNGVIIINDSD